MAKAIERRGYDRLVNLSDAVIAIAATLLILPLVDLANDIGDENLGQFLLDNIVKEFVFALSFVVIARFWLIHHALYRQIDGYNLPLIWWNFAWLLTIVFLPFPTELLATASNGNNQATSAFYIATITLTSWAGFAQQLVISRNPELQLESSRGDFSAVPAFVASVVLTLAFVLASTVPGVHEWALLLLFASSGLERLVPRRFRQRKNGPTDAHPKADTR